MTSRLAAPLSIAASICVVDLAIKWLFPGMPGSEHPRSLMYVAVGALAAGVLLGAAARVRVPAAMAGLALIAGGSAGNALDAVDGVVGNPLALGSSHWFNLADAALVVGFLLLAAGSVVSAAFGRRIA